MTLERRDTGIRLALGVPPVRLFLSTIRRGLMLTSIGIAVGLAAAIFVGHLLAGFLLGVAATDILTLVIATLLLGTSSLAHRLPCEYGSRDMLCSACPADRSGK